MRRKVSALLAVIVAMLLSVALAVPANAAIDPGKPMPVDPRFKYGMDYYYKEIFSAGGTNGVDKPPGWKPQPVSPTVNPSTSGGSWYLNNQKQARLNSTANKPLTGKLFFPGEPLPGGAPGGTVVKPPSVFKAAPVAVGSLGMRLLGGTGFGMGGVTQAPSNVNDIAAAQGIAAGCIADLKTCSSSDMNKYFAISNCGHTSTCKSIGAKDEAGNPITSDADWWKDTAIPFLGDLWAKLTGQTDQKGVASDSHVQVNPTGCKSEVALTEFRAPNNITIQNNQIARSPRPPTPSSPPWSQAQGAWDVQCGAANIASLQANSALVYSTICMDPATGKLEQSSTIGYGKNGQAINGNFNADGTNKVGLCTNAAYVLIKMWFFNTQPQSYYTNASIQVGINYTEWVNPNPDIDTINSNVVTTTVDCAAPNGQTFTYSETVKQVGAFSAPACPPGFDLARSDVKAVNAGGVGATTIDSSVADPAAAAKYPLCDTRSGPGCSLSVQLDGTVCRATRSDCATWTDIAARQPSRVQCKWGTYTMPVSDCYQIAEGYKSESGLVLDPKSGAWVAVDTNGNPVPISPQPWNPTNPNPVAGATPGTPPATGTSGSTFPQTGTDANASDNCSAPTWSWNPREFVKNPVVCALKDAFVPKTDIQARSTALANVAKDTVPISWISKPMVGPSGGGCPNWTVHVAGLDKNVVCDSSFTAAIVGARGPMFGIVASAMIWPLLRSIWYALIPIVRVTPSGSK